MRTNGCAAHQHQHARETALQWRLWCTPTRPSTYDRPTMHSTAPTHEEGGCFLQPEGGCGLV
eukprot:12913580-Prorocentrum_lima.AAC.1